MLSIACQWSQAVELSTSSSSFAEAAGNWPAGTWWQITLSVILSRSAPLSPDEQPLLTRESNHGDAGQLDCFHTPASGYV